MTSEILDRLPPQNLDAERGVLGSLLLDPSLCDEVVPLLRTEDFYAEAHRKLYGHIVSMRNAGLGVDVLLLVERLKQHGDYEVTGGGEYLKQIAQEVPVAAYAIHYAGIVRNKATLRSLIHASTQTLREAYDAELEPKDVLDKAESRLAAIQLGSYINEPVTLEAATAAALERILEIAKRRTGAGLFTGFERFDRDFGGLFPGELIILAARTRCGKTSLGTQIAHHVGTRGKTVYMASLEMDGTELATRLLCGFSGVSNQQIRTGTIGNEEVTALVGASNIVASSKVILDDRPGMSVQDIARGARRLAGKGLGLIVVDYLQRVKPQNTRTQRYEQIGEMTRGLKELARELKVPLLCLCQLGREAEKKQRPMLSDLRESGDIENDADCVMFLFRTQEPDSQGNVAVTWAVEKNRNGAIGDIPLTFIGAGTRFECASYGSTWDPDGF